MLPLCSRQDTVLCVYTKTLQYNTDLFDYSRIKAFMLTHHPRLVSKYKKMYHSAFEFYQVLLGWYVPADTRTIPNSYFRNLA